MVLSVFAGASMQRASLSFGHIIKDQACITKKVLFFYQPQHRGCYCFHLVSVCVCVCVCVRPSMHVIVTLCGPGVTLCSKNCRRRRNVPGV